MKSPYGAVERGYEARDVPARPALAFGVALILLVVLALAVCAWLAAALGGGDVLHARAEEPRRVAAPAREPVLQASPAADLRAQLARERARIGTYEWIDPAQGIVRIPVERAMELVAERARASDAGGAGGAEEGR